MIQANILNPQGTISTHPFVVINPDGSETIKNLNIYSYGNITYQFTTSVSGELENNLSIPLESSLQFSSGVWNVQLGSGAVFNSATGTFSSPSVSMNFGTSLGLPGRDMGASIGSKWEYLPDGQVKVTVQIESTIVTPYGAVQQVWVESDPYIFDPRSVTEGISDWSFSPDKIFDPQENGFLSGGLIGNAYLKLKNRHLEIDAQVDAAVNGRSTQAMNWVPPRRDPLVLDLDGGGITTSGINPNAPILFDQDGDGVQTATGWIASGEAIVVRDLNGNGTVDSGRELFGDNTILTSGPNAGQTAANGFEALADLDRDANGVADGKFDSNDVAYAGVKLWKDTNQDGVSQADELYTFDQLGVASINVSGTASNVNLGGGNTQTFSGSFTRTDGTNGDSGTAELAGSLLLVNNNFFSEFTDDPELTDEALALPEMQGSGFVRDLRAAVSLSAVPLASGQLIGSLDLGAVTVQEYLTSSGTSWYAVPVQQRAQVLQAQLEQFASRQTKAEQMADLDNLIYAWGRTSTMETSVQTNRTQALVMPDMLPELTAIEQFAAANPTLYAQITALEQFNGMPILERWVQTTRSWQWRETTGSGQWVPVDTSTVVMSGPQQQFLQQAYDALKESVYSSLVVQTRLKPYLDSIDLTIDETGIHFDTTALVAMLETHKLSDERNAFIDLVELNHYATPTLMAAGFGGAPMLRGWIDGLATDSPLRAELAAWNVYVNAATSGSERADIYFGDATTNSFTAGAGNDYLEGGAGDDLLYGGTGDDVLDGGAGNDLLSGDYANTFHGWIGGAGNDSYLFGRGDGQDVIYDLDGTADNQDRIIFKSGVSPADVTAMRLNDSLVLKIVGTSDQLTINNYFSGDGEAGWAVEQIQFKDAPETVWNVAAVKAMVLTGGDSADNLLGYASDDTLTGNGGNDSLTGRAGNDLLLGGGGDDQLIGESGNDTLVGGDGNDTQQGGSGDDVLDGGAGNDVLAGDYANTFHGWYGGAGNDTYLFGRGDGQDTIYDLDGAAGNLDKIVFKAGVLPADVVVGRSNDDMLLSIVGTADQIRVAGYFAADATSNWLIEEIHFTDDAASVWTVDIVKDKMLHGDDSDNVLVGFTLNDTMNGLGGSDQMSGGAGDDAMSGGAGNDDVRGESGNDALLGDEGADTLWGGAGNDTLSGGDGADYLHGGLGDDVMDGGAGNDTMVGNYHDGYWNSYSGAGNDTYLFGRGDGQDSIYDDDATAGNLDKIVLKAGVLPADVSLSRSGNDLILKINGTADQLMVYAYFASESTGAWQVEEIRFSDDPATVWDTSFVKTNLLIGGAGDDLLQGYVSDDYLAGNAGNDTLNAGDGNDTVEGGEGGDALRGENGNDILSGGDGADNLQGGAGNDALDGGAGNDVLIGSYYDGYWNSYNGAGNDTYLFGRGDGQDTVYDNDAAAGNLDKIIFKTGVLPADVQISRSVNDLVLKISGTTDQLTVANYFSGDVPGAWAVEEIRFSDDPASVWDTAGILAQALVGTVGNDTIQGYATDDTISAGTGNDTVYGRDGSDVLNGEAGADTLDGGNGDDVLNGGADADALIGGAGNDQLNGGDGADNLQGGTGNDTLDGGTGNDVLIGNYYDGYWNSYNGAGNDTYLFGRGDGQDTIYDYDTVAGNVDKLIFKAGVLPGDVLVSRTGNDLVLKINGTSDQVTVNSYFLNETSGESFVEEIRFADASSTVWTSTELKQLALLNGGAGNDTLIGYASDDVLAGNDGNDTLSGRAGNDKLYGGNGNDTLNGEDGNDVLYGEAGADALKGGAGDDELRGGDDADNLQGGTGIDLLDGGAGNDALIGNYYDGYWGTYNGVGNDSYLFGRGDGQDIIYDADGTAGNLDKLIFKAGVLPADIQLSRVTDNLVLKIAGTTDQVTVTNYFGTDATSGWAIEEIRFTDDPATIWSVANVKAQALMGTVVNDTLQGYATDDTINAGTGNDAVYGRDGNDVLNGEAGADTLDGGNGNDVLNGGADNDSLVAGAGNDQLNGGDGADNLQGGTGEDTFDGGAGNDVLIGNYYDGYWGTYNGVGNDSYLFGRGDGQDTIYDADGTAGNLDKIIFKAGILPADIQLSRVTDNLILKIAGTTDQMTVMNYFGTDATSGWAIEEIRFTDDPALVWTVANVKALALVGTTANDTLQGYATDDAVSAGAGNDIVYGRDGNDVLNGEAGGDTLDGGNGNDVLNGGVDNDSLIAGAGNDQLNSGDGADNLQGGIGDDVFDGGSGNDVLIGNYYDGYWGTYSGTGNDTYLFGRGDGQDTIYDSDTTAGVVDKLIFKAGVLPADVSLSRSSLDLLVKINGTTDQVTVKNYFLSDGAGGGTVEEIRFTDDASTVWNVSYVKTAVLSGGAGNDTLLGYASSDVMYGNDGVDAMSGGDGNDALNGGAGGDTLKGENGNDALNGGADADNLQGGTGNDTLDGGTGNDVLIGNYYDGYWGTYSGTGSDTYMFGRGDGQDTIYDNDTTAGVVDRIVFKSNVAPADILVSASGNNLVLKISGTTDQITVVNFLLSDATAGWAIEDILFSDGTVWDVTTLQAMLATNVLNGTATGEMLTGSSAADRIYGLDGDDVLSGAAGNDWLDGGTGNDTMSGGAGNDTYVVDSVMDLVSENASEGTDTVRASVSWALGSEVENLVLSGVSSINGTGNALANRIFGNATDNVIDGGAAADMMVGGVGNDTYVVDNTGDVVYEVAGEGVDQVNSSISYTLGADLEKLVLTGSAAINGTGNELANTLTGNSGVNVLTGGAGSDTYWLARGSGLDTIQENDATMGNTDVAQFDSDIAIDQLWFRQVSNNLEVSVIGTSDAFIVKDWYLGSQYHVEQFKTADGKTLLDGQVQSLVQAMATFTPPAAGQTTLPESYTAALNPVIAANWQ